MSEVNKLLSNDIEKIHIADREANIYELFFSTYEPNTELLIRSRHNRQLSDGSHLWDSVAQQAVLARVELQIPDKKGIKRVPIEVEVRYQNVEILRPSKSKHQYQSVELTAIIEVRQISAKYQWQEEPVHWKLLTTYIGQSNYPCNHPQ